MVQRVAQGMALVLLLLLLLLLLRVNWVCGPALNSAGRAAKAEHIGMRAAAG